MTPGAKLVTSRVLTNRQRRYSIHARHQVFDDQELVIRRDERGHLVAKIDGHEVHHRDLPQTAQALCEFPRIEDLATIVIRSDVVDVKTKNAKVWQAGRLNEELVAQLERIASSDLQKAA